MSKKKKTKGLKHQNFTARVVAMSKNYNKKNVCNNHSRYFDTNEKKNH